MWFRKQAKGGPTREEIQKRAAEQAEQSAQTETSLARGALPPYVEQRILAQKNRDIPWASTLSVNEWALCKSYGLRPLGQVMGSSYYHIAYAMQSTYGAFGSYQLVEQERAMLEGRTRALLRLQAEAALLGANAVVGVRVRIYRPPTQGQELEFSMLGTAVKVEGLPDSEKPLLCTTDAASLVKLMRGGAFPVGLAIGVCIQYQYTSRDDMWQLRSWRNQEMQNWTQASSYVRMEAVRKMQEQGRELGACGVLAHEMTFQVLEVEVERGQNDVRTDHVLQFVALGTAVTATPFGQRDFAIETCMDVGNRSQPFVKTAVE